MKTPVPQVSHRWYAGGTSRPLFHLCSTCGQQRAMRWNARNPLPRLKNHGLFHLGHQKTTYPRICAPQPRCGPVWAFPGRGGNVPRPGSRGDVGARCGNIKKFFFSAPVQFALWAKKPHPLDVGCGSRIKGGSSHPPPTTPDGRADRENGSFPRLSAPACWICTKSQNLLSYTPEV